MSDVKYRGLMRTAENGSRRSRTLMLDDASAQVQAKEARIVATDGRYLQVRYWTEEAGWTHLVVDPSCSGLASIIAIGYDQTHEDQSWKMAKTAARDTAGVEL